MFKKSIAMLLCAACFLTAAQTFVSAAGSEPLYVAVYMDSEAVNTGSSAFLLDGTTFVPIREVSAALGADTISWRSDTGTACVIDEGLELSARAGQTYVVANGRYLYIPDGVQNIGGKIMVPVRVLCQAFGAQVEWNAAERAVYITTTGEPIESGDTYYNADDLYWLSHIINAEAGCEPLTGKIAVGNVVLNRCASAQFPDSVYGVVFDRRYGTQFTPIDNGSIYYTPNDESVIAAKLALDGADTAGGSLYFIASYCAAYSWAGRNRPFVSQIGNHCFYA